MACDVRDWWRTDLQSIRHPARIATRNYSDITWQEKLCKSLACRPSVIWHLGIEANRYQVHRTKFTRQIRPRYYTIATRAVWSWSYDTFPVACLKVILGRARAPAWELLAKRQ